MTSVEQQRSQGLKALPLQQSAQHATWRQFHGATLQPSLPHAPPAAAPCPAGIWEAGGIPVDQVRLMYQGRRPEDEETLAGCGLANGCTVFFIAEAHGRLRQPAGITPSQATADGPMQC